ncbi:MAG: hypothetical protein JXR70_05905 [Spirochaetales bacterium]|nr:hypothetical protein [Spirochaetales bacterium]
MDENQLDYLDILAVFDEGFCVGLNLYEIDRIDKQTIAKGSVEEIKKIQERDTYIDLLHLLTGKSRPLDSLIYMKESLNDSPYILGISGDYEIENIAVNRIMLSPRFLRSRQEPFMHWGFLIYNEILTPLISFEYFRKEKHHG